MEQLRLEAYKRILADNPMARKAAEHCMQSHQRPEELMYLTVWAPSLLEYVCWLLREAHRAGRKRLYFLSRDAYPMYLAAKTLAEEGLTDISCRYLRVSRYALRIPEYHLLGERCIDPIFLSGIDVSINTVLNRAGLTQEEKRRVCEEAGYTEDPGRILNRRELLRYKQQFRECSGSFFEYTYAHSKEAFDHTLGYLIREGLLDEEPWAVVDSGWVGTIQRSIRNLLAVKRPDITVDGYYFGLYDIPRDALQSGCGYHSYYFGPAGRLHRKARFSNCLYEAVYSEPCAMTVGYRRTAEDDFLPVSAGNRNPNSDALERYAVLIREFAAAYAKEAGEGLPEFQPVAERLYSMLMSRPNAWEAAYYGSFVFSDDIREDTAADIAAPLTQQQLRDQGAARKLMIMLGLSDRVIHESAWIEGSIVNARAHEHRNLRRARRAKYLTHLRQSVRYQRGK